MELPERTWKANCGREDLNMFDAAKEAGWSAYTRGPVVHGLPHDSVSYRKGNKHAWKCGEFDIYKHGNEPSVYHSWWVVADLIEGRYQNHRQHDTLQDVLDKE